MTKARRHGEVDEEVDRWVDHGYSKTHCVGCEEQVAVKTICAELWDSEASQDQEHVRRRAQNVEARYYNQHPHQHRLTFKVEATAVDTQRKITKHNKRNIVATKAEFSIFCL